MNDALPLSIVESSSLRNLLHLMDPRFVVPSRNHLKKLLFSKFDEVRTNQKKQLEFPNCSRFSLTVDTWTSAATQSYLAVTAHFIDHNWKLQSECLSVTEISERHTANNLQVAIEKVISEFFGERNPTAIVSDNAANIQLATSRISYNIPCFAHTLQLCVRAGLEVTSVASLLRKGRALVAHFKHSTTATAALCEASAQHSCSSSKLIQDVPTRWNSSWEMLTRLYSMRAPVSTVLLSSTKSSESKLLLTPEEWTLVGELVEVLRPLSLVTESLSAESYPTISFAYPQFLNLINSSMQINPVDSDAVCDLKTSVSSAINQRLGANLNLTKFLGVSCLLDPRFKALSFLPRLLREEAREFAEERLLEQEATSTSNADCVLVDNTSNKDPLKPPNSVSLEILFGAELMKSCAIPYAFLKIKRISILILF